jgi:branched-subunit amino acid ABC-type transport system permease component
VTAWSYYISTLTVYFGVNVLSALSLNLQFGFAGVVNFGYILFQAVGAYFAAVVVLGPSGGTFQQYIFGARLPFPVELLVAIAAGAVLAAVALAADGREARSKTARRRAINGAVQGVAQVLGNTPAVARRSYIDPRVFDRYLSGWTIGAALDRIGSLEGPDDRARRRLELAVLELLVDYRHSSAVQRIDAVSD